MPEKSIYWTTGGAGDGAATYTQAELFAFFRRMFIGNAATEFVLDGFANNLAVSGTASPVVVATGAAIVNGIPYESDTPVNVTVPTPLVGTTGHRVILRANYAARTVRIALKSSSDGVSALPALTQTDGTTWEVGLASLTITTGGVITLTDTRGFARFRSRVSTAMLDLASIGTNQLADNSITAVKIPNGTVTQAKLGADTLRTANIGITYNILRSSASTPPGSWITVTDGSANLYLDGSRIPPGANIKFVATVQASAANSSSIRLFNITDNTPVTGSAIAFATASIIELVSGSCTIPAGEKRYGIQILSPANTTTFQILSAYVYITW